MSNGLKLSGCDTCQISVEPIYLAPGAINFINLSNQSIRVSRNEKVIALVNDEINDQLSLTKYV